MIGRIRTVICHVGCISVKTMLIMAFLKLDVGFSSYHKPVVNFRLGPIYCPVTSQSTLYTLPRLQQISIAVDFIRSENSLEQAVEWVTQPTSGYIRSTSF